MITLLLALCAWADTPVVLDTLGQWAEIGTHQLTLDGVQASRATLATLDSHTYGVTATFGALQSETQGPTASQPLQPRRPTRVELVVGNDQLDSARFVGRRNQDPLSHPSLVVDDVPIAMARDLWLATDASFKRAVKQYQVKQGALAQLGGEAPPDYSAAPPVQSITAPPAPSVDSAALRQLAIDASASLRTIPGLRNGRVYIRATEGSYLLATSEGTRLAQPEGMVAVYAVADVLTADGVLVIDKVQWVVRNQADLPDRDAVIAQVRAMGERVAARAKASPEPYYEGPVVFEGPAAADLLRYLAEPELLGTPPVPSPRRTYEQLIRKGPRLGRRLFGPGWQVVDDPSTAPPGSAAGYVYDREGVAGQRLELVRDGFVRDLAMTRVPRHDLDHSNGHARGSVQGKWKASLSAWTVSPPRTLSDRAFEKLVARTFKASGAQRILVVRSLRSGRQGQIPRPANAVWRQPDGSETPVLSLEFQKADRRALRDIVAAAGRQTHAYLGGGGRAGTTSGVPEVITAPNRLLISELEAAFPGADSPPPILLAPAL